jgi:DNA-binding response OmpR family regulator
LKYFSVLREAYSVILMKSPNHKETILLIDDEPGFRRIYTSVFTFAGFEVLEAEDGEKGFKMVIEHQPSVILLDLLIPHMNGFDVLKKIRETERVKHIPVMIFTVMGEAREIAIGMSLGANDYVIKGTTTPKEILDKIQAILSTSKSNGEQDSYYLFPNKNRGDSLKIQQIFNLPELFVCPNCTKPLALELQPEYNPSKPKGHWFKAHFYCKSCNTDY